MRHAIDDADRQLAVSRDVIAGHRGWIGADARTRLAEAERIRVDLDRYLGTSASAATAIDEDQPRAGARHGPPRRLPRERGPPARAARHRRLTSAGRPRPVGRPNQGWGGGGAAAASGMGGILGGLVIGSLLGDIFDG